MPKIHRQIWQSGLAGFCILQVTALTQIAQAVTLNLVGSGFTIFDNSVQISQITILDDLTIDDLTVTLNSLNHTYIGDLIATLTHVNTNRTVELFNRPGRNSVNLLGYGIDFNGSYSFNDASQGNLWATAETISANEVLPPGNYFPSRAIDGNFSSPSLATFSGQSTAGTWRLTISDNSLGNTGSLGSWGLSINTVSDSSVAAVPFEFSPLPGVVLIGVWSLIQQQKRKKVNKE